MIGVFFQDSYGNKFGKRGINCLNSKDLKRANALLQVNQRLESCDKLQFAICKIERIINETFNGMIFSTQWEVDDDFLRFTDTFVAIDGTLLNQDKIRLISRNIDLGNDMINFNGAPKKKERKKPSASDYGFDSSDDSSVIGPFVYQPDQFDDSDIDIDPENGIHDQCIQLKWKKIKSFREGRRRNMRSTEYYKYGLIFWKQHLLA